MEIERDRGMKKKGIVVAVIGWIDASQDSGGEIYLKSDGVSLLFAVSAGLVVKETKEYIAIARDYFPHVTDKTCDQVRAREVILKKNIEWVKRFII